MVNRLNHGIARSKAECEGTVRSELSLRLYMRHVIFELSYEAPFGPFERGRLHPVECADG